MRSRLILALLGVLVTVNGSIHSAEQQELPPDCMTADFVKTGRPLMFAPRKGLAMGISAPQNVFHKGNPMSIYVWVNNQTDREQELSSCSLWFDWGIEVYDAEGQRVATRREMQPKSSDVLKRPPQVCFRDVPLPIPPHYCGLLRDVRDVTIDLSKEYDLPAGRYFVTEKHRNHSQRGLAIAIHDRTSKQHEPG